VEVYRKRIDNPITKTLGAMPIRDDPRETGDEVPNLQVVRVKYVRTVPVDENAAYPLREERSPDDGSFVNDEDPLSSVQQGASHSRPEHTGADDEEIVYHP